VKKYFLPLFCLLLSACNSDKDQQLPTAGLLPKEKMVSILIDIHIAESKLMQRNISPDSTEIYFKAYKEEIYKKHGVTRKDFEENYKYYMDNIQQMDAIYAIVVDSLSLKESRGQLH
jgi:hypothetical protein